MKKTRLAIVLAIVTAMVLSLAACGGGSSSAPSGGDSGSASGGVSMMLIMGQRDEFLGTLESGARDKAAELGVALDVQDANQDSNKMQSFVENAKSAGCKAVIVNLVDPETAQTIVEAAGDMKVVFVNRIPTDTSVLNENAIYVGSNENDSGRFQGEALVKYFNDKGQKDVSYILLKGIEGHTSTALRTDSVLKALTDGGLNATQACEPQAAKYERAEAMNRVDTILGDSKVKFDCIIANNDEMALGAIEAMESKGLDPASVPIVGIDATEAGRNAIKDGKLYMSVFQNGPGQGAASVQAALNMINGTAITEGTDYSVDAENANILWVPFEPVTADNVADYD
ncbi:MAG: substrate-binding domain-containing protein [Sarcina sp.]|nr:substrate-binding domain-containing protein [Sarcina sp.]